MNPVRPAIIHGNSDKVYKDIIQPWTTPDFITLHTADVGDMNYDYINFELTKQ
ncbi:MAG: hypothetical protein IPF54_01300 [Draconibacterium sp.]|nr:hypothetical protein [Draconibacterium sp.]